MEIRASRARWRPEAAGPGANAGGRAGRRAARITSYMRPPLGKIPGGAEAVRVMPHEFAYPKVSPVVTAPGAQASSPPAAPPSSATPRSAPAR